MNKILLTLMAFVITSNIFAAEKGDEAVGQEVFAELRLKSSLNGSRGELTTHAVAMAAALAAGIAKEEAVNASDTQGAEKPLSAKQLRALRETNRYVSPTDSLARGRAQSASAPASPKIKGSMLEASEGNQLARTTSGSATDSIVKRIACLAAEASSSQHSSGTATPASVSSEPAE